MIRLSATEAAGRFSEILKRVAAGEEIEVTRAGAPVAVIGPPKVLVTSAERFRELLGSAPPVDDDFAEDVRTIRRSLGPQQDSQPF
jgi:antitoxin (DNA-binding transcriptional repressor) of toxin-antitoxin stability system